MIKSNAVFVFYSFFPKLYAVSVTPRIHCILDNSQISTGAMSWRHVNIWQQVKLNVHQYVLGGSCWASSCLRQRFLAALRLSFLAVVGLI